MNKKIVWTSILLLSCAAWFAFSVPLTAAGGNGITQPPDSPLHVATSDHTNGTTALSQTQTHDAASGPTASGQAQAFDAIPGTASQGPAAEATQGSAPNAAPSGEVSLDRQVNEWIHTLAKEKGFETWNSARWDKYPLGPGIHEWLILLHEKNNQQDVGYLIVGATEQGGYRLIEYGTEKNPLFSLNTLYHSLVQLELIPKNTSYEAFVREQFHRIKPERLYLVPLQAAWRLTKDGATLYIDAKTGRKLPDLSGAFPTGTSPAPTASKTQAGGQAPSGARILQRLEKESFDPFENTGWVHGKPTASQSFDAVRELLLLQSHRITYSGKWFGGKAVYPLAVTGYHVWNTEGPFVRLDHDGGPRFVRFAEADSLGHYYPYLLDRETAKNLL